MADEDTTTTTTVAETTTTTTQANSGEQVAGTQEDQAKTTMTDQVTSAGTTLPSVEKRGEMVVDNGADAKVLGGPGYDAKQDAAVSAENIENSKRDALRNHAAEHVDVTDGNADDKKANRGVKS